MLIAKQTGGLNEGKFARRWRSVYDCVRAKSRAHCRPWQQPLLLLGIAAIGQINFLHYLPPATLYLFPTLLRPTHPTLSLFPHPLHLACLPGNFHLAWLRVSEFYRSSFFHFKFVTGVLLCVDVIFVGMHARFLSLSFDPDAIIM